MELLIKGYVATPKIRFRGQGHLGVNQPLPGKVSLLIRRNLASRAGLRPVPCPPLCKRKSLPVAPLPALYPSDGGFSTARRSVSSS